MSKQQKRNNNKNKNNNNGCSNTSNKNNFANENGSQASKKQLSFITFPYKGNKSKKLLNLKNIFAKIST